MPSVIQQALRKKAAQSDIFRQIKQDFALLTGLELYLVDSRNHAEPEQPAPPPSVICKKLAQSHAGRCLCEAAIRRVLQAAGRQPVCIECDAGLAEAAVSLRIGGTDIGYLRVAGFRPKALTRSGMQRIEHLLNRSGIPLKRDALALLHARVPALAPDVTQALLRLMETNARRLESKIQSTTDDQAPDTPKLVQSATTMIQSYALRQDLTLQTVASRCGVTASHLSRVFHQTTGMTFRQYMAGFRAHHARAMLVNSDKPITAICLESGFQSVSQFNRVIKSIYQQSPREIRAQARQSAG